MYDIFRDSCFGDCVRLVSGNRLAKFPEDSSLGFLKLPANLREPAIRIDATGNPIPNPEYPDHESQPREVTQEESDNAHVAEEDASVLVTWYSPSDPDNPQNWGNVKRAWVSFVILLYTFSIYIGSSLYTASTQDVCEVFGVSLIAASVGLSIYVLGYSIGPLLWSPLSEIPAVGRNLPYVLTFFIFVVLCIPTSLVNNFAGLLVLRFLLGFFGSPALATGGASYGDFYGERQMPYVIAFWGAGATLGPSLGPLVAGFAVQYESWRWSSWELLWLCAPVFILMFVSLPETSSDLILLRRAQRLRRLTGRADLKAASEIKRGRAIRLGKVAFEALIKPWEINIKDPAVLFSTIYTALIYGIYYSFFESFAIVYGDYYGFSISQVGLAFLAVLIGLLLAVVLYCAYFYFVGDRKMAVQHEATGFVPPEARLWPGLVATFLIPVGLFIFAWTANANIPWVASLIGVSVSMVGVFVITQCMFIYLPFTYPKYAGSLFAANGFARGAFAAGAILFSRPMFDRLGVNGGVSLLGGLTVVCIGGIYGLYFLGAQLRARSKFAT